jgi:M6 family metalloprotease-like protein
MFYREMSNDVLDVQGATFGWFLDPTNPATFYLDACPGEDPTDCSTGRSRLHALWVSALQAFDAAADLGQFDNDGPDGLPNSGDDDGEVDVVQFTQPVIGGECGGGGIWAHRWFLSALGGSQFVSNDPRTGGGGGFIRADSYFVASGVGGGGPGNRAGCAAPTQLSGIGTPAHEFGHAVGLPDLYDTGGNSQGVGEWGLMGSGSYTSTNSPAHHDAWSKETLGWVTVRELTTDGTYQLGPIVTGDTVLLVRPLGANPRGEYFLLENKQALGADSANILVGGNGGPKDGGLLVWHVDSLKVVQALFVNGVNAGSPHGVSLIQADGLNSLGSPCSTCRGDAGDPYPGSSRNDALSYSSNPALAKNADGAFAGLGLDSIAQVTPGGAVSFRLRFGRPLLVTVSGNGVVNSNPPLPSDTLLAPGDTVTLTAVAGPGSTFDGWTGDTATANDTVRLTMDRSWSVQAVFVLPLAASFGTPGPGVMGAAYSIAPTASGGRGTYTWSLAGGALPEGLTIATNGTIAGVPAETGQFGFTARVVSGSQSTDIPLTLSISAPALATAAVLNALVGTSTLSADEERYLDLLGNRNSALDVGDFLAFIRTTGGAVSAATMAELLRKEGGR